MLKKKKSNKKSKKSNKTPQISAKKRKLTTETRQDSFIAAFLSERFNISAACRKCEIDRKTFYLWKKSPDFLEKFEDAIQERIDFAESALHRNIQAGDTTAIIFFLKTIGKARGYIEGEKVKVGEAPAKRAVEILEKLIAGEIDITQAALSFDRDGLPLPESVRLLLQKAEVPAPPPDLPPAMKDEELEEGYQRMQAKIKKQEEKWLPQRQEEVRKIKDELKDVESFGPDAENKKREGNKA